MQLAMIGLGKMGANMTTRLLKGGHEVVVFDLSSDAIRAAEQGGAVGATTLGEVAAKLSSPKVCWLMVPAGPATEHTLENLADLLSAGDILIDGGNSYYKDSVRRAEILGAKGIHLVDVGTSGGVWGLAEGYSMMVGGADEAVAHVTPILETLAPAADKGWGHVGPAGSGHFVKMVHNGIEYGMMQAYAEGFALLKAKGEFGLDLHQTAEIWRYGSVIRSWLLDLTSDALNDDLTSVSPFVPDSGEGRWTVQEAVELGLSLPVITQSLFERFRSRDEAGYPDRLLSLMRNAFGGHMVKEVVKREVEV